MGSNVKKIMKKFILSGVVCMLLLTVSNASQVNAAGAKMKVAPREKENRNVTVTITAKNIEEVNISEFYYYDSKNKLHNLKTSSVAKYQNGSDTITLKYKCDPKKSGTYTLSVEGTYNDGTYYSLYKEFTYIKKADDKVYVGLGTDDREVNIGDYTYRKSAPYKLPNNKSEEIIAPNKEYTVKVLYRSQKKGISRNEVYLKWGNKTIYPNSTPVKSGGLADNYISYVATFALDTKSDNEGTLTASSGGSNMSLKKKLVVDGAKPVVKIDGKFTGNKTKYFNKDVSVPVTIEEKNFDSGKTTVTINGKSTNVSWSGSGSSQRASVKLHEGKNVIEVQSTDKAGNKSKTAKSCEIIVDKKSPKVEIKGFENGTGKGLKNGEKVPYPLTITITDETKLGSQSVNLYKLSDDGKRKSKIELQSSGDDKKVEYYIDDLKDDGYYTLTVTANDKAGNEPKKSTVKSEGKRPYNLSKGKIKGVFTVNREGSLYMAENEELFNKPIKDLDDIVIYEYNKNEISEHSVVIIDSISTKTLDAGQYDFRKLDESDNPKYKYKYEYVIKKDNFSEGNYNIQINSTSIAGKNGTLIARTEESNSLNKTIILDKTTPEIVLFEGTSGGKIKLKIRDDNIDEESVKILLAGKTYELKKNDDESTSTNIVFEGDIGKNPTNAEVSCSDLAGNIQKGGKITVIKESVIKQVLIYGGLTLGVLIFIVGTVIIIIMVNRKKK